MSMTIMIISMFVFTFISMIIVVIIIVTITDRRHAYDTHDGDHTRHPHPQKSDLINVIITFELQRIS